VISSITLEIARRNLRRSLHNAYAKYVLLTALLGAGFLGSQLIAWRQLTAQGIYLASHPHSSFFYLLTGAHAVHLVGGLLALAYLWFRSRSQAAEPMAKAKREATADAVTIYWHFMDGLWIYLFLLLFLWR
jgi:cytochrome c oxidase subunit 3